MNSSCRKKKGFQENSEKKISNQSTEEMKEKHRERIKEMQAKRKESERNN